jgi:hypothetical protein
MVRQGVSWESSAYVAITQSNAEALKVVRVLMQVLPQERIQSSSAFSCQALAYASAC